LYDYEQSMFPTGHLNHGIMYYVMAN